MSPRTWRRTLGCGKIRNMGSTTKSRISFGVTAAVTMALIGASGACVSLGKQSDAVTPQIQLGGYTTVSQCPSFLAYQSEADPVLQRLCISCHAGGGLGAANMLLVAGDSTDNDTAAANFYVVRNEAVPTDGSVTVDPTNPMVLHRCFSG